MAVGKKWRNLPAVSYAEFWSEFVPMVWERLSNFVNVVVVEVQSTEGWPYPLSQHIRMERSLSLSSVARPCFLWERTIVKTTRAVFS